MLLLSGLLNTKKTGKFYCIFKINLLTTKHSTKLNQQNYSYCQSREKLLISGDIESNTGPVAHGTSTHIVLRSPSMALLQAQLAQKRLKVLECTSDGSCFFSSVAHQLYNDPSYHMNVHAAGVEYIRHNRQRFIGPITEQLWVCCRSNIHGVMHFCESSFQCSKCNNTYK